jgi:hypothetical protein
VPPLREADEGRITWFRRHSGPGHQVRGETARGPQRWECRCGASTVRFAPIWWASDARFRDRLNCHVPGEDELAAEALERAVVGPSGYWDGAYRMVDTTRHHNPQDGLLAEVLYVEPRAVPGR